MTNKKVKTVKKEKTVKNVKKEKKEGVTKETLKYAVIPIKDEFKESHMVEIIGEYKADHRTFMILLLEDLKNSKNFELIRMLHDFLDVNDINVGCIISGENHFSAILMLSSVRIKYRSATYDTQFVYDKDDYIKKNFESDDTYFTGKLNRHFGSGNLFNADAILAAYKEGDDISAFKAYVLGIIDNIITFSKEDFEDETYRIDIIKDVISVTRLYIERMKNIKDYLFGLIQKLY
ncbi:MAG: hypothetical protein NTY74_13920 [Ignavibacteriae bacterium]|nr:hypothetical protein [Ignavibacteriota bacterium]